MGVCIIGGGLAGLTTALKLKERDPLRKVVVLEKTAPESNTQISGQRYRARISGKGIDPETEISYLLASRNTGELISPMKEFSSLAIQELNVLLKRGIPYEDRAEWFGPRVGNTNRSGTGRGKSVLDFFKGLALYSGVDFYEGEAKRLIFEDERITGVIILDETATYRRVEADRYILAGGSLGGRLFNSTNRSIRFTPQELAYQIGLPLVDSTLHMIHPFGNCTKDGKRKIGCHETDELSEVEVYFTNGDRDDETTRLLQEHQAHYYFPEISQRFMDNGGTVRLLFPNEKEVYAGVSYHYSHLAVATIDGVRVRGMENLLAVGDASGLGYQTNHQCRFPGFALTKCLVDAEVCCRLFEGESLRQSIEIKRSEPEVEDRFDRTQELRIRNINTKYLFDTTFGISGLSSDRISQAQIADLLALEKISSSGLLDISLGAAFAHLRRALDPTLHEPLYITKELVEEMKNQSGYEISMGNFCERR